MHMKKLVAFTMVLILALSLLAGCGGGSGSSSSGSGSSPSSGSSTASSDGSSTNNANSSGSSRSSSDTGKPGSTHDPANNPPRKVEPPSQPVDLADDSIYFVIIDGVKYSLFDRTIQDFLDAGYSMSKAEDPNEEVEPSEKSGGSPGSFVRFSTDIYKRSYSDSSDYFHLRSYNATDKPLPLKDCSVYEIYFDYDKYAEDDDTAISALIYTVGNLAPGCTEEDVISVFGEDYDAWMYDYGELIYSDRTLSRSWEFYRDNPGDPVRRIKINTNFGY